MTKKIAVKANPQNVQISAPEAPRGYGAGEKVEVTAGDIPDDTGQKAIASARGVRGRTLGAYAAVGGPHKGEIMQEIEVDSPDGRAVISAPISRVNRHSPTSQRHFGMPRVSEERWDQIFGKKKRSRR